MLLLAIKQPRGAIASAESLVSEALVLKGAEVGLRDEIHLQVPTCDSPFTVHALLFLTASIFTPVTVI